MPLPAPTIIGLEPENWIDLDKLDGGPLATYVQYDGLEQFGSFWPNWRGCSALGEAIDDADSEHTVYDPLGPEGERIDISNGLLQRLDQGWVFYSYLIPDATDPHEPGEESQRVFFYVGKRDLPALTGGLGVAQFKESHDLQISLAWIDTNAIVVAPAYRAMSVGDRVTLRLEFYYDEDSDVEDEYEKLITLAAEHLNRPLEWKVPKARLSVNEGYLVDARYTIVYAAPTTATVSPVQRLQVVNEVTGHLPALTIKDFTDSALDPEQFPDGVVLQVPLYPGIQVDDVLVLYADSAAPQLKAQRVDLTTLDSRVLEFPLEYTWLADNNGKQMKLGYAYARAGAAGRAQPLEVMLRRPLDLKTPIVEEATADGEGSGHLYADVHTNGVYVNIPPAAEIGDAVRIDMHWEGHPGTGNTIVTEPQAGTPRRYKIPPAAVPANMNKHVKVFYRVWTADGGPYTSGVFDLEVRFPIGGWPTIQVSLPKDAPPIYLSAAAIEGAQLTLGAWIFMAPGQRVNVTLESETPSGGFIKPEVRTGDQELVTPNESTNRQLQVPLPLSVLQEFKCPGQFRVYVKTSFDDGGHYETFRDIDVDLEP